MAVGEDHGAHEGGFGKECDGHSDARYHQLILGRSPMEISVEEVVADGAETAGEEDDDHRRGDEPVEGRSPSMYFAGYFEAGAGGDAGGAGGVEGRRRDGGVVR